MPRFTNAELIQEAELVILDSKDKLTLTTLAAEVNARLKSRYPRWCGNLGKGRLLDAIVKSKRIRLKGDISVLADATLMKGGMQAARIARRKR